MSRLWSRFGVRALAVLVLLLGAGGGYLLGQDRQTQQQVASEQVSAELDTQAQQNELDYLRDRQAAQVIAEANRRAAQLDAARKAAAAAKAEAERARRAEAAASRKKEREAAEAAARAEAEREQQQQQQQQQAEPDVGPIPASCSEYSGNREIGCALLLDFGFGIDQMPCLDKLWTKESGWNHLASNPYSGAYGIPQALPGSKMGSVADDWETNPATQIKWGLGYVKDRYGTPCDAWAHSQSVGWY